MKTIYIVEMVKGDYEDTSWNNIKAFTDKEMAEKYRTRISEVFKKLGAFYNEKYKEVVNIPVDDDYNFAVWETYMNRMENYYGVQFYVSELTLI